MQWALVPPYPNEFTLARRMPAVGQLSSLVGTLTARQSNAPLVPSGVLVTYPKSPVVEGNGRVRLLEPEVRSNLAPFQRVDGLDEACEARHTFNVADICFDRADGQRLCPVSLGVQSRCYRSCLLGVAGRGAFQGLEQYTR